MEGGFKNRSHPADVLNPFVRNDVMYLLTLGTDNFRKPASPYFSNLSKGRITGTITYRWLGDTKDVNNNPILTENIGSNPSEQ